MTEDLRKRRQFSYLTHVWDDVDLPYTFNDIDVAGQTIEFFKNGSDLIYPAKSYFVAIVYAKFLEKYFGCDFFKTLDDLELLPDDKFFVRYSEAPDVYNQILSDINLSTILDLPSTQKTVKYAQMEFSVPDGIDCKDN